MEKAEIKRFVLGKNGCVLKLELKECKEKTAYFTSVVCFFVALKVLGNLQLFRMYFSSTVLPSINGERIIMRKEYVEGKIMELKAT